MPKDTTEAALLRRSIAERWPVTAEERERVMARLVAIAGGDDTRAAVAAARGLIAADQINLKQAELWLQQHGPGNEGGEDAVIVDGDPEIARLEAELIARRAAVGQGDSRGAGVGNDVGPVEVAESATPDAAECRAEDCGDDAE